ncbi:glycosyltransferase family 4 protein [Glacieibacterium frigidum]|uniref:Glycosyltransferase family 4 protein n=2 Tax=Glacieibacterium frigidum TaxID=2593303 RepID=A0A552U9J2_9SPHN|nr:glycosyltransferase family 4 protein [Glacieibacterium frigidum]
MTPWGEQRHGGALRSEQIAALVTHALPDALHVAAPYPRSLPPRRKAAMALRGSLAALASPTAPLEAVFGAWLERALAPAGLRRGDLLIYDADPRYGPALMRLAARRGFRTVVLPHNIEALIPKTWPIAVEPRATAEVLTTEVAWMARADAVWTIGVFDRDLLALFGIAAVQLPYTPPPARRAELLEVRAARMPAPGAPLLIVGTVHNPPTRAGMIEQIALAQALDLPVIVAGFGTEVLRGETGGGATILGGQSWPELAALMASAHALWVHQTPMSGALTRIPEALIAGLPVLANAWAAHGHGPLTGIQVYAEASELPALIAGLPATVPPPDNAAADAAFISALRQAAGVTD